MPAPGAPDADDDELGPIDFLAIELPGELMKVGLLTEEEFTQQKARILNG